MKWLTQNFCQGAYNHNQICLVKNYFQWLKKVIFFNLSLVSSISDLQGGVMVKCPPKFAKAHI